MDHFSPRSSLWGQRGRGVTNEPQWHLEKTSDVEAEIGAVLYVRMICGQVWVRGFTPFASRIKAIKEFHLPTWNVGCPQWLLKQKPTNIFEHCYFQKRLSHAVTSLRGAWSSGWLTAPGLEPGKHNIVRVWQDNLWGGLRRSPKAWNPTRQKRLFNRCPCPGSWG